jgi:hypothetical protein
LRFRLVFSCINSGVDMDALRMYNWVTEWPSVATSVIEENEPKVIIDGYWQEVIVYEGQRMLCLLSFMIKKQSLMILHHSENFKKSKI